jgi:hypothetical protein
MLQQIPHFITGLLIMCLATASQCHAQEAITEPEANGAIGAPNNSVVCRAVGLDYYTFYDMKLRMKLSGTDLWFDVGATDTYVHVNGIDTTLSVAYNPGPGTHGGLAQLRTLSYGQATIILEQSFSWVGQPQP